MPRSLMSRSLALTLLAAGVAGAVALVPLTPAGADAPGVLAVAPATGSASTALTLTTAGPCTDPTATAVQARITGSGFAAAGQPITGVTPIEALSPDAAGGYALPLSETLRDFGNRQSPPVVFAGDYLVTIKCRTNTGTASLGEFTRTVTFSSPTAYAQAALTQPSTGASPATSPAGDGPSGEPTTTAGPTAGPTSGPTAGSTTGPTTGPTTAPTTTAAAVALDAEGAPLAVDPALRAGQVVTLTAAGFVADEPVTATVFSTPVVLGTVAADSAGLVSYAFTVPNALPDGAHHLQLAGANHTAAFAFHLGDVADPVDPVIAQSGGAGVLARTGSNTTKVLFAGVFLLWAGAMLLLHVGSGSASQRPGQPRSRGRHAMS